MIKIFFGLKINSFVLLAHQRPSLGTLIVINKSLLIYFFELKKMKSLQCISFNVSKFVPQLLSGNEVVSLVKDLLILVIEFHIFHLIKKITKKKFT